MRINLVQILIISLSVIGLLLVALGTYIEIEAYSQILIAFGAALLGASISSFFNSFSTKNLENFINSNISEDIFSHEDKLVNYRKKYHFFWITKFEGNPRWYHSVIDFTKVKTNGKLWGSYNVVTPGKSKLKYTVKGGIRDKTLIIHIDPSYGSEPKIIGIFPDFALEYKNKNTGLIFHKSYDNVEIIAPSVLCSNKIEDCTSVGFVKESVSKS